MTHPIPQGYKQTEIGVIPEDWHIRKLGEICTLINGRGFKPYEWSDEGLPIIRIQNLNGSEDFNYFRGHYDPKIFVQFGQLLFAWSGSRGTSFGPHIWYGGDALLNYHTWKLVVKSDSVDTKCFFHILKQLTKQIEEAAHGASALVHTQKGEMENFYIPLPPKPEQTAIAAALSDVDALISGLESLIAKKQAIKTATMQQLLTGKTRLPQFAHHPDGTAKGYQQTELGLIPEDWEVRFFSELGEIDPENLGSTTPLDYEFDYISLEQVERGVLLGTTKMTFREAPSRARRVLKKGDILVSTVRPNLKSHYFIQHEIQDLVCSTGFSVIRFFENKLFSGYLYQHLFSSVINNQIEMLISGSNYPSINSGDVKQLKVQIGSVEEQTAIAQILSDMDEEIQALETRLSKTKQIKQGMMQVLLTGKVRLV